METYDLHYQIYGKKAQILNARQIGPIPICQINQHPLNKMLNKYYPNTDGYEHVSRTFEITGVPFLIVLHNDGRNKYTSLAGDNQIACFSNLGYDALDAIILNGMSHSDQTLLAIAIRCINNDRMGQVIMAVAYARKLSPDMEMQTILKHCVLSDNEISQWEQPIENAMNVIWNSSQPARTMKTMTESANRGLDELVASTKKCSLASSIAVSRQARKAIAT